MEFIEKLKGLTIKNVVGLVVLAVVVVAAMPRVWHVIVSVGNALMDGLGNK